MNSTTANSKNKAVISNSSSMEFDSADGSWGFCNVLPFKVGAIYAIGLFLSNVTKVLNKDPN